MRHFIYKHSHVLFFIAWGAFILIMARVAPHLIAPGCNLSADGAC